MIASRDARARELTRLPRPRICRARSRGQVVLNELDKAAYKVWVAESLERCATCGRSFGRDAYKRHVKGCNSDSFRHNYATVDRSLSRTSLGSKHSGDAWAAYGSSAGPGMWASVRASKSFEKLAELAPAIAEEAEEAAAEADAAAAARAHPRVSVPGPIVLNPANVDRRRVVPSEKSVAATREAKARDHEARKAEAYAALEAAAAQGDAGATYELALQSQRGGPKGAPSSARAARATAARARARSAFVRVLFRVADRQPDGVISRGELVRALRETPELCAALGLRHHAKPVRQEGSSRDEFEALFRALDDTADGTVSPAEFERFVILREERELIGGASGGAGGGASGAAFAAVRGAATRLLFRLADSRSAAASTATSCSRRWARSPSSATCSTCPRA